MKKMGEGPALSLLGGREEGEGCRGRRRTILKEEVYDGEMKGRTVNTNFSKGYFGLKKIHSQGNAPIPMVW